MIGRKAKQGSEETAEVNIAPLIDVVFLLIVFFMSIWQAAHIEVAAKLSLPSASQANPQLQQDRDRLIINVDLYGDYYVAKTKLSQQQLTALLAREANRPGNRDAEGFVKRPIFIRADADRPFSEIQDIMLICRDVGIWRLCLRTKELKEEGATE